MPKCHVMEVRIPRYPIKSCLTFFSLIQLWPQNKTENQSIVSLPTEITDLALHIVVLAPLVWEQGCAPSRQHFIILDCYNGSSNSLIHPRDCLVNSRTSTMLHGAPKSTCECALACICFAQWIELAKAKQIYILSRLECFCLNSGILSLWMQPNIS